MRADAHAPLSAADGPIQDMRAAEGVGCFCLAFAAKLEAGRAADHLEGSASRQALDDLFTDTVRKELHFRIAGQVVESKDRQNRFRSFKRICRDDRVTRRVGSRSISAPRVQASNALADRRNYQARQYCQRNHATQERFVLANPAAYLTDALHTAWILAAI